MNNSQAAPNVLTNKEKTPGVLQRQGFFHAPLYLETYLGERSDDHITVHSENQTPSYRWRCSCKAAPQVAASGRFPAWGPKLRKRMGSRATEQSASLEAATVGNVVHGDYQYKLNPGSAWQQPGALASL